jgi:hypothetical protein
MSNIKFLQCIDLAITTFAEGNLHLFNTGIAPELGQVSTEIGP